MSFHSFLVDSTFLHTSLIVGPQSGVEFLGEALLPSWQCDWDDGKCRLGQAEEVRAHLAARAVLCCQDHSSQWARPEFPLPQPGLHILHCLVVHLFLVSNSECIVEISLHH